MDTYAEDPLKGFVPANYTVGKRQRLIRGLEALGRIKSDMVWEDWMLALDAFVQIEDHLSAEMDVTDRDDRAFQKAFIEKWESFQRLGGDNVPLLSKQERWALRFLIKEPKVRSWRDGLPTTQQRKLNHPNNVINKWKAVIRETDPDKAHSKSELEGRELLRLDAENDALRRERDHWKDQVEWQMLETVAATEELLIKLLRTQRAQIQYATLARIADDLGFTDLVGLLLRDAKTMRRRGRA